MLGVLPFGEDPALSETLMERRPYFGQRPSILFGSRVLKGVAAEDREDIVHSTIHCT